MGEEYYRWIAERAERKNHRRLWSCIFFWSMRSTVKLELISFCGGWIWGDTHTIGILQERLINWIFYRSRVRAHYRGIGKWWVMRGRKSWMRQFLCACLHSLGDTFSDGDVGGVIRLGYWTASSTSISIVGLHRLVSTLQDLRVSLLWRSVATMNVLGCVWEVVDFARREGGLVWKIWKGHS